MVFKKKPVTPVAPPWPPVARELPPPPAPPEPPTLLRLERENLARLQKELNELHLQEHNKEQVIAHVRENISLLERHPWFEDLYAELRSREMDVPEAPRQVSPEFMETVRRAQEQGILNKPKVENPSGTV